MSPQEQDGSFGDGPLLEALASRKTGEQRSVREVELDEMQSFVGDKEAARWLWHALDHPTGHTVAYVVGSRADDAFLKLKALLGPFGFTRYYSDKWGAYRRHLPATPFRTEALPAEGDHACHP